MANRTKGPYLTIGFCDNLEHSSAASELFKAMEESFVSYEQVESLIDEGASKDDYIVYKKVPLRYQPLIYVDSFLPLEVWLGCDGEAVPFKERGFEGSENISWDFALNNKLKIAYVDGRDMARSINEPTMFQMLDSGILMLTNSSIYTVKEWQGGLKEFIISAAGKSLILESQKARDFDYSAAMRVSLDNQVLGEVFAEEDKFSTFTFRSFIPSGWHKLEIAFTNDIYEPQKGWDRNLLVKDVEVYSLLGNIYLKVKRGMEEKYLPGNYTLSYFRVLDDDSKNTLLLFFKRRFNIKSLRDIVLKGYNIRSLMREVEINNLARQVIFAAAPTKIRIKAKVPADGIKFTFGFGIMQEAWDKPGDGVEFSVRLDTPEGSPEEVLFSRYINPKANEKDRKWFQGEVDLRRFKGQEVSLIFETRGSPISPITSFQDFSYDWAVWSG
jgi:hypothetical protein